MDEDSDHGVIPGWEHVRIKSKAPRAITLEAFMYALEQDALELYVRALPRQELTVTEDEAVQKFREAATRYLFR